MATTAAPAPTGGVPAPGFSSAAGFPNQGQPPTAGAQQAAPTGSPGASPPPGGAQSGAGMPGSAAAGGAGQNHGSGGAAAGGHGAMDPKKINPYIYTPSFSMAIIGAIGFLIAFFIHTVQLFKTKAWYFNLMPQAVLMAAIGMIARCNSIITLKETGATGPFVVAAMMENIAPTLTTFGMIFTYTRLLWWVTPNEKRDFKTLWAPPKHNSLMWGLMFTAGDGTKAVVQNLLKPQDPLAHKITETAQIVQLFLYAAFFFISLRFMRMSRRWLVHGSVEEKNWRQLGWTIVAAAGILFLRHVFTIVALDARSDPKGFWSLHEWVYWMAEPIPLFIVFCLFSNAHPGHFLPREYIGFRLKVKQLEKSKLENPWPLTISPPIRNDDYFIRQDDKGMEVRLTELESGRRY